MEKGYLALVLHAHLPYVRHPESENYIEERWLYEAVTESYVPLLQVFESLSKDNIDFRITISLTPTLLSMLADPILQARYLSYIDNLVKLAGKEASRNKGHEHLESLSRMYLERFKEIRRLFKEEYDGNIILGFKKFQDLGRLEIITSSATHAFLPYVKTEQSLRAQIENAVKVHKQYLGRAPRGIWLPECGCHPGLDLLLKEFGIEFFFTDTHAVMHANPKPSCGVYAPVVTREGVAAFARDPQSSEQVWSSHAGYPGDYDYREYYRDIGYDSEYEYIKPYLHQSGLRLNTGIKYYRITGEGEQKDYYQPQWAMDKAKKHAGNFMFNREKQIEHLSTWMDRKPIVTASFDAELFGHWWYEGPMWLESLCRQIHAVGRIQMITPVQYLKEYPANEIVDLSMSSWGRGGYGEVWMGQSNEWIYRHLHRMEQQMTQLADRFKVPDVLEERAMNQAARELMLAQSSDWAFIMDAGTMVDYAVKRTKNHIGRFDRIYEGLLHGSLDSLWLQEVENRDSLFPFIDYRTFRSERNNETRSVQPASRLKILMLSWEYPPMTVGGLSRHVFDLSRHLAGLGVEVHVVTSFVHGYPSYEINQGVHVHRVQTYQAGEIDFMEWVFQLNLAMIDYCRTLISKYVHFDLIHAHDWIVCQAAKSLKHLFEIPLVSTIHATEHGRNQGIRTDLQRRIHHLEWTLTYESARVIGCSQYMEREIGQLFELPADKIDIIPNGVDPQQLRINQQIPDGKERFARPDEQIVFFVGRLVREKGVHVLIESIPAILEHCPQAKFIISGKGPMLGELQQKARNTGVGDKVLFTGFIDDETRNQLLQLSSATVFPSLYEPFGIVALEAMAAGTPVIVSDVGGMAEIIVHGEDGLKVFPGHVQSLVDQITSLLENPVLSEKLRKNAVAKINERYLWDHIAVQTTNVYRKVVQPSVSLDTALLEAAVTVK